MKVWFTKYTYFVMSVVACMCDSVPDTIFALGQAV